MRKFFGYIRVSTAKQGEQGVFLQEQRDAIVCYARRHGLEIASWFEERETAAKRGRPVFTHAEEMCRLGLRNRNGSRVTHTGLSALLNNPFYIDLIRLKRLTDAYLDGVLEKDLFEQRKAALLVASRFENSNGSPERTRTVVRGKITRLSLPVPTRYLALDEPQRERFAGILPYLERGIPRRDFDAGGAAVRLITLRALFSAGPPAGARTSLGGNQDNYPAA